MNTAQNTVLTTEQIEQLNHLLSLISTAMKEIAPFDVRHDVEVRCGQAANGGNLVLSLFSWDSNGQLSTHALVHSSDDNKLDASFLQGALDRYRASARNIQSRLVTMEGSAK